MKSSVLGHYNETSLSVIYQNLFRRQLGGRPDGLLCVYNVRLQKVWCRGVRSFLCSWNARPQKGPFDGRSRKLLAPLLGRAMNWESTRVVEDQSGPISEERTTLVEDEMAN